MSRSNLIIGGVILALLLGIGGWSGWSLHKTLRPCPTITTDTVTIIDTNTYNLRDSFRLELSNLQKQVDYWKAHRDTIILPGDSIPVPTVVDTAAILRDYFAVYSYGWSKEDSNILVKDSVIVTQNTPVWHNLTYKLNRPFTTVINNVDNSITYNRYVQAGLSMPVYGYDTTKVNVQNLTLEGTYVWDKGYIGIGWQPNTQSIMARAGVTLFKFRKIK